MKRKIINKCAVSLIFNRWRNTSWAVFYSMGKIIKISLLSISYFLMSIFSVSAQSDTIDINEISIESTRTPLLFNESARVIFIISKEEIKSMPVQSVQDLLENISSIDVRQRGAEGVQADIGIRGGTFEQTLILINGFKINDVQTGHHNMNLPIDIENIDKIEILEGPGGRVFGTNAYSGAINIITNTKKEDKIKFSIFGGEHDYYGLNAGLSYNYKKLNNNLSLTYKKSNGYLEDDSINNTDFDIINIFYQSRLDTKIANFFYQAGYTNKSFGANSFYTPAYPWQYEQTKTFFSSFKIIRKQENYKLVANIYMRRQHDRFELFREDKFHRSGSYFVSEINDTAKFVPGIFEDWNYYKGHNYHQSNVITGEIKYDLRTNAGKTAVGVEYSNAHILSNVLGEELDNPEDVPNESYGKFTKSKNRYNINLYGEHVFSFNKFLASAGISANYNEDYSWNFSSGVDFSYKLTNNIKSFASINQAVRLPSFTDLYYAGPSDIGNPDLKPEKAISYETGVKFINKNITGQVSIFQRNGKNTIDRVKLNEDDKWQSQNITELTVLGGEISIKYNFERNMFVKNIRIAYAYTDITKQSNEYISNYMLDYLKHKVVSSLNHRIFGRFSASWQYRYEKREGSYYAYDLNTRTFDTNKKKYKNIFITDLKIFWQNNRFNIFTEASNLFNINYKELGNIKMSGRWIKAGIKINLNF